MKKILFLLLVISISYTVKSQFQLGTWGYERGLLFYATSSQPFAGDRNQLLSLCTVAPPPQFQDPDVLILRNTATGVVSIFVRTIVGGLPVWKFGSCDPGGSMPVLQPKENGGYNVYWNGVLSQFTID